MITVIPVLDLKNGIAVHAVAGDRERYQPLRTILAQTPQPGRIAETLAMRLGASQVYVADLDAIAGADPDFASLSEIAAAGLSMLVDAATVTPERAAILAGAEFSRTHLAGVVLGLESVRAMAPLRATIELIGTERCVFSLDLRDGRPIASCSKWKDSSPRQIVADVVAMGVRRFIVLDLARVGVSAGVGVGRLCQDLRDKLPEIELMAGGGVRGVEDLEWLARCGCDAALVGSAIHNGKIGRQECSGTSR